MFWYRVFLASIDNSLDMWIRNIIHNFYTTYILVSIDSICEEIVDDRRL